VCTGENFAMLFQCAGWFKNKNEITKSFVALQIFWTAQKIKKGL
jgi:hypothetical protein